MQKLSSIQNLYFEEVFEAAFYLEKMEELVMAFHKPEQIAELVIEAGVQKVSQTLPAMLILGFRRSVYFARFLLNIRVLGNLPERWGV